MNNTKPIVDALQNLGVRIDDSIAEIGDAFTATRHGETVNVTDALMHLACQFVSPNESDRNLEAANVVDGLFAIARSLQAIADAIKGTP